MMNQFHWKPQCQSGAKINKKPAMAVLTSVLIISAVLLTIALGMGVNAISENQIGLYQSKAQRLLINAEGCVDEALTQLSGDDTYTGDTITIDGSSCTIVVSGNGSNRTIDVTASESDYTKNLRIEASLNPTMTISSWQEITI